MIDHPAAPSGPRSDAVRGHYEAETGPDLPGRIRTLLEALPPGPVDPKHLAGLDQFHMGGLPATLRLVELADPAPGAAVLDAGSGLGGPARILAATRGCRVVGVDLSPAYVSLAAMLAERTGLADAVTFQPGDLLALPFPDARFDLVWTQHVAMNIADRAGLYGGFRRVLKPGGRLALHDVLRVDGAADPVYPVPWAETAADSTLLTEAGTLDVLRRSGFRPVHWVDVTQEALAWAAQPRPAASGGAASGGTPNGGAASGGTGVAVTLGAVMGARFGGMAANFARNLREGRLRIVMGVFEAA
ncbi:MAG TPA: methyltransferase domain-containing protein [Rhodopila sp.]|uniref:class I SAM-dependent methyltransferase n=1 Tax=Rhodopila sp. TaxID=2480087 RepID=UPI002C9D35AA|nr:methyltransferase domain-containing protein [Rhodopila sp.]HVY15793.1 methyltransferase domain-containing protein [Rhodopila sp.]